MGVSESMALMPVASGSLTDWRSITPGAWSSRARRSSDSMSPRPSIGVPSGSMTRPMKASPTGTERISPVRRTVCPSSILSKSPRTTTPISRVSRFRAMPRVPSSNSSSSLAMADGRPATRAMPSAHCATVPTSSLLAASGLKSSTYFDSASRISSGRIVSSVISSLLSCVFEKEVRWSADQTPSGVVEPAGDGAVDDLVPELDADATDDVRVDHDVEVHGDGVLVAEDLGQAHLVGVAQGPGDANGRNGLTLRLRGDL